MKGKTLGSLIKLIIFAVVTAFVTSLLAITISNGSFGGGLRSYKAIFTDTTGLLPGDDVRIAGVRVGHVETIKIYHRRLALVTFGLQSGVPLRASSQLQIRYQNMVGQRYIELNEGPGNDTVLGPGAMIPLAQTRPALDLTVLFNGFKPLFRALDPETVNRLSYEIIATLQGEGQTFDQLVQDTASLTTTIANRDAAVGAVVGNLDAVLATVDQRNRGLADLLDQMQRLVTGLAGDRQTISASLGNVNSLASSTASLLQGIRPALPSDLSSLSRLANTLATTKYPDGHVILDEWLKWFPNKLNIIIRTATYGSWFNFWLCNADARIGQSMSPRLHVTNSPACDA